MAVLLLAGGPPKSLGLVVKGSRSRSLVPLLDSTLLDYILDALHASLSMRDIVVISDDLGVAETCSERGCKFVKQVGTGIEAAMCSGLSEVECDRFLVIYGDVFAEREFYKAGIDELIASTDEYMIMAVAPHYHKPSYLRVDVNYVNMLVEQVGSGEHVFAGLAVLPVDKVKEFVCKRGAKISELLSSLALQGKLKALIWTGAWVDIDTPWDYLAANVIALYLMLRKTAISPHAKVADTAQIEGAVYVADGATIDHYAVVKGPAFIGPSALIGAHAFVREYTAVYRGGVVGAYTEVKRSVIMPAATISSHCYIADSVVGEEAMVAPYTVTLNVPMSEVPPEARASAVVPFDKLKVGAVICHSTRTKPFQYMEPGKIYQARNT